MDVRKENNAERLEYESAIHEFRNRFAVGWGEAWRMMSSVSDLLKIWVPVGMLSRSWVTCFWSLREWYGPAIW